MPKKLFDNVPERGQMTLKSIQKAQTQSQIAQILEHDRHVSVYTDSFISHHYHCRYLKNQYKWSKADSSQPTDLNDARNMALTAVRAYYRPR